MRKKDVIQRLICLAVSLLFVYSPFCYAHLCDNVFRQADKLIVKPENYNMVVRDRLKFKIFLQNNMDREIAELSLRASSKAFNFKIAPRMMSIPQNQRVFFTVEMVPKPRIKSGNYPVRFQLVDGGRELKTFKIDSSVSAEKEQAQRAKTDLVKFDSSRLPSSNQAGLLELRPTDRLPQIDGRLDDQCWQSAAVASNFSSSQGGMAVYQTVALLNYDSENLYCAIYCFKEDSAGLALDDELEIRLATDPSGYPYYSVTLWAISAASFKKVLKPQTRSSWKNAAAQYAISKNEQAWMAELSLPFAAFDVNSPAANGKWYLRIIRTKASGEQEKSYWSADSSGYNSEQGFGEFIFIP